MADDRIKNDDLNKDMGRSGPKGDDFGKQTPGRNPQQDRSSDQRSGENKEAFGEDDDFDSGSSGQSGNQDF
jgi:hypothetical protein